MHYQTLVGKKADSAVFGVVMLGQCTARAYAWAHNILTALSKREEASSGTKNLLGKWVKVLLSIACCIASRFSDTVPSICAKSIKALIMRGVANKIALTFHTKVYMSGISWQHCTMLAGTKNTTEYDLFPFPAVLCAAKVQLYFVAGYKIIDAF